MNVAILALNGPGVGMVIGRDRGDFMKLRSNAGTSKPMATLRIAVVLMLLMLGGL